MLLLYKIFVCCFGYTTAVEPRWFDSRFSSKNWFVFLLLPNSIRETRANEYHYSLTKRLDQTRFLLLFSSFHSSFTLAHSHTQPNQAACGDGSHADYRHSSFCQMVHCHVELRKMRYVLHNILTLLLNQLGTN